MPMRVSDSSMQYTVHAKQNEIARWAVQCFGPKTMDRKERATRVLEEALELAQAEGIRKH